MEILQEQGKELQIIYSSASLLELDLSIAKSTRHILIYWAVKSCLSEQYTTSNKQKVLEFTWLSKVSFSDCNKTESFSHRFLTQFQF